jgi:predicted amidohydrolase YtcJ
VPASPSHRPLDSIRAAMLRRTAAGVQLDPSEGVTFLEALAAHTLDAAYGAFDERELGSIEVGKQADLAVWNTDLRMVRTAADVDRLQVLATYVSGEQKWTAPPM